MIPSALPSTKETPPDPRNSNWETFKSFYTEHNKHTGYQIDTLVNTIKCMTQRFQNFIDLLVKDAAPQATAIAT